MTDVVSDPALLEESYPGSCRQYRNRFILTLIAVSSARIGSFTLRSKGFSGHIYEETNSSFEHFAFLLSAFAIEMRIEKVYDRRITVPPLPLKLGHSFHR